MKVLFMGSDSFAVPSLELLVDNNLIDIVGVVSKLAKPKNRGKKLIDNQVVEFAKGNNIKNIILSNTLKNEEIQKEIMSIDFDVIVVISFGLIIPDALLRKTHKKPVINVHPSCLPLLRGASPVERSIQSGLEAVDICIIDVDSKVDAGNILYRNSEYKIDYSKNGVEIKEDISKQCAKILENFLINNIDDSLNSAYIQSLEQNHLLTTYAPKIEDSELLLNFSHTAKDLMCQIKAFANYGCYFMLAGGEKIKIFDAFYSHTEIETKGIFDANLKSITCQDGMLVPIILQKAGGKKLLSKDFFNGTKIPHGTNCNSM